MTVLDTFYLRFKSNAKDAERDVDSLEKKIDSLKAKGKERSEQENKDLKESIKRQKELTQNLKDQDRQAEKLVDNLAGVAAAYVGFNAIKSGILNTAEFNRNLAVQARNLNLNKKELREYGAAVKQFGGDEGSFRGFLAGKAGEAAAIGQPFDAKNYITNLRKLIENMSPEGQLLFLQDQGVPVDSYGLFRSSDEEFNRTMASAAEFAKASEDAYAESEKLAKSLNKLGDASTTLFSAITSGGETIDALANAMVNLSNKINFLRKISFIDLMLDPTGTLKKAAEDEKDANDENKSKTGSVGGSPMEMLIERGYSREQAAAISANIHHESAGDAMARGDSGLAHGLIQWHPDRRAAILKATGIDVSTAGASDQIAALDWEMKNISRKGWNYEKFKEMSDPQEAAAYFSSKFVSPRDEFGQSMARARTAMEIVNGTSFGNLTGGGTGSTTSIKIDNINIETQATDAAGIGDALRTELESSFRNLSANWDDGVAR